MSKIGPFITGAAIGALAALLLAPQAGEKTRALVVEKANAVAGEAKDFGAGFPGSAQDALKTAQARVKEAAGQPAEIDSDDLREKIEAARKRIAAQVMENAEASKAVDIAAEAVDGAKHAAAEKVAEAAEAVAEAAQDAQ